MISREDQLERIARYLDGEAVELTDADRAFLAEHRRLEGFAAAQLDESVPSTAMPRATNRLRAAALWNRRWRHGRRALAVGTTLAAAAAAIIVAVTTLWQPALPPGSVYYPPNPDVAYVPTDVILGSLDWSTDLSNEMDMLAAEVEFVEGQVATWPDSNLDDGLKAVERDLDDFYEDDSLESLLLDAETSG